MQTEIEQLFDNKPAEYTAAHRALFDGFLAGDDNAHAFVAAQVKPG